MDEYQPPYAPQGKFGAFKQFIIECQRVLRVTKKPSNEEFKTIVKISGLGLLLIGAVGFTIHLFKQLFFG